MGYWIGYANLVLVRPWTFPTLNQIAQPQPQNRRWSLREAADRVLPVNITFNNSQDQLTWECSNTGEYSSKSCYEVMIKGGKTEWHFAFTWNLRIPPTVKVFAFLCLKGKLLTHDVMLRKGLQCDLWCITCQYCRFETTMHLLFQCNYALIYWRRIVSLVGCRLVQIGYSIQSTFIKSWRACRGKLTRHKWGTLFLAGC